MLSALQLKCQCCKQINQMEIADLNDHLFTVADEICYCPSLTYKVKSIKTDIFIDGSFQHLKHFFLVIHFAACEIHTIHASMLAQSSRKMKCTDSSEEWRTWMTSHHQLNMGVPNNSRQKLMFARVDTIASQSARYTGDTTTLLLVSYTASHETMHYNPLEPVACTCCL